MSGGPARRPGRDRLRSTGTAGVRLPALGATVPRHARDPQDGAAVADYLAQHDIRGLMRELSESLIFNMPQSPRSFLRSRLRAPPEHADEKHAVGWGDHASLDSSILVRLQVERAGQNGHQLVSTSRVLAARDKLARHRLHEEFASIIGTLLWSSNDAQLSHASSPHQGGAVQPTTDAAHTGADSFAPPKHAPSTALHGSGTLQHQSAACITPQDEDDVNVVEPGGVAELFEKLASDDGKLDQGKLAQNTAAVEALAFELGVDPGAFLRALTVAQQTGPAITRAGFALLLRREAELAALAAWLQSDSGLLRSLAELLPRGAPGDPLAGVLALRTDPQALDVLCASAGTRTAQVFRATVEAVSRADQGSAPVGGSESGSGGNSKFAAQFAVDGDTLATAVFGTLEDFDQGLDAKIGPPNPNIEVRLGHRDRDRQTNRRTHMHMCTRTHTHNNFLNECE